MESAGVSIHQTAGAAAVQPTVDHATKAGVVDGTASLRAGQRAIHRLQEPERAEAAAIVGLVEFEEGNLTGFLEYTSLVR